MSPLEEVAKVRELAAELQRHPGAQSSLLITAGLELCFEAGQSAQQIMDHLVGMVATMAALEALRRAVAEPAVTSRKPTGKPS